MEIMSIQLDTQRPPSLHLPSPLFMQRRRSVLSAQTCAVYMLGLLSALCIGCVETQVTTPQGGEQVVEGGEQTPQPSPDEITARLRDSALLIRVIPIDESMRGERRVQRD